METTSSNTKNESFFIRHDDRFIPTELCRGPWDVRFQHGGPPSALLGCEIEAFLAAHELEFQVARIHIEITKPVPLAPVGIHCQFERRGRQVVTISATMTLDDGTAICSAKATCIRIADISLPESPVINVPAPLSPQESNPVEFNFFTAAVGYQTAIELRSARGDLGDGNVVFWMRSRFPLIAGEPTSPLQRTLVVADSGNGVSQRYSSKEVAFLNPDLDVALFRSPVGEWIALEAITWPGSTGRGLADTRLWDTDGVIGRGTQTLLLAKVGD